jgi:hypothetical protein
MVFREVSVIEVREVLRAWLAGKSERAVAAQARPQSTEGGGCAAAHFPSTPRRLRGRPSGIPGHPEPPGGSGQHAGHAAVLARLMRRAALTRSCRNSA